MEPAPREAIPHLLDLHLDDIFDSAPTDADADAFPEVWTVGDVELPLDYEFDETSAHDGVTVDGADLPLLGRVDAAVFDWNVPGLREELVTALLRSMPKEVRKAFVPIPDTVADDPAGAVRGRRRPASRRSGGSLREISGEPLPPTRSCSIGCPTISARSTGSRPTTVTSWCRGATSPRSAPASTPR